MIGWFIFARAVHHEVQLIFAGESTTNSFDSRPARNMASARIGAVNQTNSYPPSTPRPVPDRCVLPLLHGIPIVIINFTLVFVGTFGNFLIIMAVLNTHRLRRKISNFLLLSLAAADLFVTMLAQPLHAISVTFTTFRQYCIPEIDFAYDIAGNFSVFCSIFHLAAISIDRALVVTKPHQHQRIMKGYGLRLMLCICWGSAITFTPFRVKFSSASMMSIGLVVFNFAIIIVSYAVILNQITRTKVISNDSAASALSSASRDARMERRVAGTIAIIILFFSICWFPLLGFYISAGNAVLRELGGVTYMWIRTLVLSNSSMNFIVYSCRIDHFRVAYMRIIKRLIHRPGTLLQITKFSASVGASQGSRDNDVRELPGLFEGSVDEKYVRSPWITKSARNISSAEESAKEATKELSEDLGDANSMTSIPAQVHCGTVEESTRQKDQERSISNCT